MPNREVATPDRVLRGISDFRRGPLPGIPRGGICNLPLAQADVVRVHVERRITRVGRGHADVHQSTER